MKRIKFLIFQFISISALILNSYFLGPYMRKPFSITMLIMSTLYIAMTAIFMYVSFTLFQRSKEISLLQRIVIIAACFLLFVLLVGYPLGKIGFQ